jgi:hypothetical protein
MPENNQQPVKPGYAAPLEGTFDNPATRLLLGVAFLSVSMSLMRNYGMMLGMGMAAPLLAGKELATMGQSVMTPNALAGNTIAGPAASMTAAPAIQSPMLKAPTMPTPKMGGGGLT